MWKLAKLFKVVTVRSAHSGVLRAAPQIGLIKRREIRTEEISLSLIPFVSRFALFYRRSLGALSGLPLPLHITYRGQLGSCTLKLEQRAAFFQAAA